MDRTIVRDLFRPSAEFFGAGGRLQPQETGWCADVEQWLAQQQTGQGEEAARAKAVCAGAQALSLQSTMLGAAPTALINGSVLREGQWINGFRLKYITSNAVLVTKDGVDVELRMK